jgi:late competence protein required for DNA uptake (superfamily II DNA/RNA helicase)
MRSLSLNGTPSNSHQMKFCDKCETKQPPEGGVQMSVGRWYCASCWLKRNRKEEKTKGKP